MTTKTTTFHKDAYGRIGSPRDCIECEGKGTSWGETCLTCGGKGVTCEDEKAKCSRCEEEEISPNIEAFEAFDQIVCDDCAEELFEENGQFGVGA